MLSPCPPTYLSSPSILRVNPLQSVGLSPPLTACRRSYIGSVANACLPSNVSMATAPVPMTVTCASQPGLTCTIRVTVSCALSMFAAAEFNERDRFQMSPLDYPWLECSLLQGASAITLGFPPAATANYWDCLQQMTPAASPCGRSLSWIPIRLLRLCSRLSPSRGRRRLTLNCHIHRQDWRHHRCRGAAHLPAL